MSGPAPPQPPGYNAPFMQQQTTVPNYGTYQPVAYHAASDAVVVGQPQTAGNVTLVHCKPKNYILLSICTLLCCCWLFGIVALIHGMQVDSAYASGDIVGAQIASRIARSWNMAAVVFGSFIIIILVIASTIMIFILLMATQRY